MFPKLCSDIPSNLYRRITSLAGQQKGDRNFHIHFQMEPLSIGLDTASIIRVCDGRPGTRTVTVVLRVGGVRGVEIDELGELGIIHAGCLCLELKSMKRSWMLKHSLAWAMGVVSKYHTIKS